MPSASAWRPRRATLACALLLPGVLISSVSCAHYYAGAGAGDRTPPAADALSVVYLIGDFGKPAGPFDDLVAALADDVEDLSAGALRTPPMILELGDNLYEEGLPHDLDPPRARAEIAKLRAVASGFARVRYRAAQVPIVVVPGNHDYYDDALVNEGNLGDISRWYFLADLGIEGAAAWTQVPGDAARFATAAELYAFLDGNPAGHAEFMAPAPVPHLDAGMRVWAIDSELLLDLYEEGHEELADGYWEALDRQLAAAPAGAWRFVATHHPPVTNGVHDEPSLGNWLLGQGWPQFPAPRHKLLAAALPLAAALGVAVHPAAALVSGVIPLSTAFVTKRKQDVGSNAYDRYAAALLRLVGKHRLDGVFAAHEHNTQLIELGAIDPAYGAALLVITGAGSKVGPVRRGPGTVAFLADYSYVRVTQSGAGLSFQIVDRRGESRYRYHLPRR